MTTDSDAPRRDTRKWKVGQRCLDCGGRTVRDATAEWRICVDCGQEWPETAYQTKERE
jgi:hypothetical protein